MIITVTALQDISDRTVELQLLSAPWESDVIGNKAMTLLSIGVVSLISLSLI